MIRESNSLKNQELKLKSWTLNVEEDSKTGEGILTLPEDLLKEAGWKEGDNLLWIDNKDGTWSLIKEDLTNFVIKGIINNE
jgi:hypothetical protein